MKSTRIIFLSLVTSLVLGLISCKKEEPIAPILSEIEDQSAVDGQETNSILFDSDIDDTTFLWVNDMPSIGLGESGTGNIPSFTAINKTNESIVATISVTPKANGVTGNQEVFTITVLPSTTSLISYSTWNLDRLDLYEEGELIDSSVIEGYTYDFNSDNYILTIHQEGQDDELYNWGLNSEEDMFHVSPIDSSEIWWFTIEILTDSDFEYSYSTTMGGIPIKIVYVHSH